MGRAIVCNLDQGVEADVVGPAGVPLDKLEAAPPGINSGKLSLHPLGLLDKNHTTQLMENYDASVLSVLNRKSSHHLQDHLPSGFVNK